MIGGGVMSDIPDWLVELAAQGDLDDDEASESASELQASESSAVSLQDSGSEAQVFGDTDIFSQSTEDVDVAADEVEDDATQDLMVTLRNQVAAGAAEEGVKVEDASARSFSLRIPGLLPWQQLVLTVLLFLDVVVIGLLILVMAGRVAIF